MGRLSVSKSLLATMLLVLGLLTASFAASEGNGSANQSRTVFSEGKASANTSAENLSQGQAEDAMQGILDSLASLSEVITKNPLIIIFVFLAAVIGLVAAIITIGDWQKKRKKEPAPPTSPESPRDLDDKRILNIPFPENPNFTGRTKILEELAKAPSSSPQIFALIGLGGMGKTQVALKHIFDHRDDYMYIWWLRSEEPAVLAGDYARMAKDLNLPAKDFQDLSEVAVAVRRWLEGPQDSRWLMVFDNAKAPDKIEGYIPRAGNGQVIITSRHPLWSSMAKPLPIDEMEPKEAVEFLLKRTGQKDEAAARALAKELGCLPLALEQAGAYILETGIGLSGYLSRFQERWQEILKLGRPISYRDTVATTWEISFQDVEKESPAAADLLNLLAFLAPEDIPRSLLAAGAKPLPEPLASVVKDRLELDKAVAALRRYSLIEATGGLLSVHRCVQAVTRDRLDEEGRKRWAGAAVKLLDGAFSFDENEVKTWALCSPLLPHALAAAGHAEKLEVAHEVVGHLLNETGEYLRKIAEFTESKSALERALKIDEKTFGPDHPEVAIRINNLGLVLQAQNDMEGAKKCFKRAIKIGEKTLGANHPQVAIYINNLGLVLRAQGDLDGAKKLYEEAVTIGETTLGLDHPQVAIYLSNLGTVLHAQNDMEGAKKNLERAIKIGEKTLGLDHPQVAIYLSNLGSLLKDQGDLQGAKKLIERALKIEEKVFGPDHPNVAIRINNLGLVLQAQNDLEGAKKCFKRAIKIGERTLGADHPNVAICISNLGLVLQAQGDLEGAKRCYERALMIHEKALGPDHPEVATDINNLGMVLQDLGDLEGAKKSLERALKIFRDRLGEDYPNTVAVRSNLQALEAQLRENER